MWWICNSQREREGRARGKVTRRSIKEKNATETSNKAATKSLVQAGGRRPRTHVLAPVNKMIAVLRWCSARTAFPLPLPLPYPCPV